MRSLTAALTLLFAASCSDPVHDRAVEALGPERAGVPPGPLHRPGQPCLTCHGGDGPSSLVMSFGGTAYAQLDGDAPAAGAAVRVLDAKQRTYDVPANCVGNFWVPRVAFEPVFPVTAAVTVSGFSRVMTTQMRRNGSCGDCHTRPASAASPGPIWVLPDGVDPPPATCTRDEAPSGTAGAIPGCPTTTPDCGDPPPTYADVAPIFAAHCTTCHQPKGENSNPLLTTYAAASASKTRTTTNSLVSLCTMPPPPVPPLSDADRTTLICWTLKGSK